MKHLIRNSLICTKKRSPHLIILGQLQCRYARTRRGAFKVQGESEKHSNHSFNLAVVVVVELVLPEVKVMLLHRLEVLQRLASNSVCV